MTRDEIFELGAGSELDTMIAEKVMGAGKLEGPRLNDESGREILYWNPGYCSAPDYSTNIADAWQVLEKFDEDQTGVEVINYDHDTFRMGHWEVIINGYSVIEKTAPLAICKAALLAVSSDKVNLC